MKARTKKEDLQFKLEKLSKAEAQLKKEFFGIDSIIEKLIQQIKSWYLFPELQKRPLVVNLWGMTGTGKSSLLKRLAELIEFDKSFFPFDMNDEDNFQISNSLIELQENKNGLPFMLLFDEFQHLRSIDNKGNFLKNKLSKIIWKIIDEGQFVDFQLKMLNGDYIRKLKKLKEALASGVVVKNGEVVENKLLFAQITNMDWEEMDNYFIDDPSYLKKRRRFNRQGLDDNMGPEEVVKKYKIRFVSFDFIHELVSCLQSNEYSLSEEDKTFQKLNGEESIEYIESLIEMALSPKYINCTKAIVFICGNLDRAYPMSQHISPDIDADIFYQQSLNVNISTIKNALSEFLRKEQLARLGNIHLIYPALSRRAYEQIVEQQLSILSKEVKASEGIQLVFSKELKEMLYAEGVYPTQGSRPLLSTIRQYIHNYLGEVLGEVQLNSWENTDKIQWNYHNQTFQLSYFNKKKKHGEKDLVVQPTLASIKDDSDGERRVIVAVHEAGHALVYRLLYGESPLMVISNSASYDAGGYTVFNPDDYNSKIKSIQRLSVLLGGFCAEKLIFGTESITSGSSSDLMEAKVLAMQMGQYWGFQKFRSSSAYQESMVFNQSNGNESHQFINEAFTIAGDIVKKYESVLLKLSNALIEKDSLKKDEIEQIVLSEAKGLAAKKQEGKEKKFYISQFKAKAKELSSSSLR